MRGVRKDNAANYRFTLRTLLLVVTAVAAYLAISRLADLSGKYGEPASLVVHGWILILWFNAVLVLNTSGCATIYNAVVGGGLLTLDTEVMHHAAELWARCRSQGWPLSSEQALDGDVILAAQAQLVCGTIVTTNRKHLEILVPAKSWEEIVIGPPA